MFAQQSLPFLLNDGSLVLCNFRFELFLLLLLDFLLLQNATTLGNQGIYSATMFELLHASLRLLHLFNPIIFGKFSH
jgi:hypothetical protein